MFNMAVVPSLLYGLVQMDIGHFRAGTRGRLIPSNPGEFWGALAKVTHAALRAIFPVWRTIPTPLLWWLAGATPSTCWSGNERERWRARVQTLPPDHPLWRRLQSPPYKGWSRLHQLAADAQPGSVWEPRRPGLRAWLGLSPSPLKPRKIPPPDLESLWRSNKPQSSLWDGPSAKPFLALLDRKFLARWVAEASGHGDFLEYHVKFNHPPSAYQNLPLWFDSL